MSVTEIESELKKMTNAERLFIIEIATQLVRRTFKEKPKLFLAEKRRKLKSSAKIMLSAYSNDMELTVLNSLDGEDFLDA